jgi:hypothetical protein
MGLIDMVHVPQLPADGKLDYPCCVLSYWRRNLDPGTILRQRVVFEYREDGTRWVLPGEEIVDLRDRHLFCAIRQIRGLPVGGYGQHMFVVQRQDNPGDDWVDAPPTAGLWVASNEMVAGIAPVTEVSEPR